MEFAGEDANRAEVPRHCPCVQFGIRSLVNANALVDAEVMVGGSSWSERYFAAQTGFTRVNGEFELTVGKRRAYAVSAEGGGLFRGRRLRRENQSRLSRIIEDV
jgi:hypothetical protein